MGYTLTGKGWAAASRPEPDPECCCLYDGDLTLPAAERHCYSCPVHGENVARPCGHKCVVCQGSELTPEWRSYMLLLFRIQELEAAIENAHSTMLVTGLTRYRDRLIERRDAVWADLQ